MAGSFTFLPLLQAEKLQQIRFSLTPDGFEFGLTLGVSPTSQMIKWFLLYIHQIVKDVSSTASHSHGLMYWLLNNLLIGFAILPISF